MCTVLADTARIEFVSMKRKLTEMLSTGRIQMCVHNDLFSCDMVSRIYRCHRYRLTASTNRYCHGIFYFAGGGDNCRSYLSSIFKINRCVRVVHLLQSINHLFEKQAHTDNYSDAKQYIPVSQDSKAD